MASSLLYSAETWDVVYKAFEQVNFSAYDFASVKQSLLDTLKLNYPENFNDYTEASQIVALIELFAYVAEQLAYRVDMSTHESTISTAQRKQMILRQAKFLSYSASRNLPLRGLVKVMSISCSEDIVDSQGNSLSNRAIKWADAANSLWREQFNLVMGRTLTRPVGAPLKVAKVNDVVFKQHEVRNLLETEADGTAFINGVLPYTLDVNGRSLTFELVPADVDSDGVFERSPSPASHFSMLYADDGYGETSPMTGFMLFTKQGVLNKLKYAFDYKLPNRVLDVNVANVNDIDVWLHEVTEADSLIDEWEQVDNVDGENLFFNLSSTFKKYEVETLEDDKVRLVFGDDDFASIPTGIFNIWLRASDGGDTTVPKNALANRTFTLAYTSAQGRRESCTFVVSLTSALQNGSIPEELEHIRRAAPAVYQTAGRMVNGEDYNSYPLKDSSILHLKTVNRTFAGQPKYVEWNDASGSYQTVKMFGDDGRLYFDIGSSVTTTKASARSLINDVLEPMLAAPGVYNLLTYSFFAVGSPLSLAYVRPRIRFIEDSSIGLYEKTTLQGALDRHWYGEPDTLVQLGPDLSPTSTPKAYYAVVNDDADQRIYDQNRKLVTNASGVYTLVSSPGNVSGIQDSVMRQRRFGVRFNPIKNFASDLIINDGDVSALGAYDSLTVAAVGSDAVAEALTVEIINEDGEFTVTGSVTGSHVQGVLDEVYDNDIISFLIGFPTGADETVIPGDAWIINLAESSGVLTPTVYKRNLNGEFTIINELSLPTDAETMAYNAEDDVASWVLLIERNDDADGQLDYWRVTARNFQLALGSPTTKFWFDRDSVIVDGETRTRVQDNVKVLKSNLDLAGLPLGVDQKFFVVDVMRHSDGTINPYGLLVSPDTVNNEADSIIRASTAYNFLSLIGYESTYVYFKADVDTGRLTMIDPTAYITSLTYDEQGASGVYRRMPGRAPIDFSWTHYVGGDNLVDPSPANIHDMYVLTRGFYASMRMYLDGLSTKPTPPTPFELRTTYRSLLQKKMLSDTVVLHPAKVKLLFGDKAVPELRAKLKLVKALGTRATDDQLRTKTLALVNSYFNIEEWGFGKTFYATELISVIQKALAVDLASVVLVPELPASSFGDMLQVRAEADELLMSALELKDIMVITDLSRTALRIR